MHAPKDASLEAMFGMRLAQAAQAAMCAALCLAAAGCGEKLSEIKQKVAEQVESAVEQGVEKTKQAVAKVEQKVAPQPEGLEFDAGGPVRAEVCYVTLSRVREGEPAILELSTYESGKVEKYPSVYVRAEVSAANLAELQGQKLQAQVYLQHKPDGPVWQTAEGAHVVLSVVTASNERIACEVAEGQLVNMADGSAIQLKGKLFAKLVPAT